jgi:hypothetical protein
MNRKMGLVLAGVLAAIVTVGKLGVAQGTESGTLRGTVSIKNNGSPVISATVLIIQLNRSTTTDSQGKYEFKEVPAGQYEVTSQMHALTDEMQTVNIASSGITVADFQLSFAQLRHEVTVTATGHAETTFESFQAVTSRESTRAASAPGVRAPFCADLTAIVSWSSPTGCPQAPYPRNRENMRNLSTPRTWTGSRSSKGRRPCSMAAMRSGEW